MRKIFASFVRAGAAFIFCVSLFAGSSAKMATVAGARQHESRRAYYQNFDVEVIVEGRPAAEYSARGRRYVEAVRNGEYELRVRNPLPVRVAVALSVDGLNTIDARRTGSWAASKWVIEPYQTVTVGGWQMSPERARRFYFTTEQNSYAAKLGRPSDLGLITAVFYREQRPRPIPLQRGGVDGEPREKETRSADHQSAPAARAESARRQPGGVIPPTTNDDYAATGIGRSVRHGVRWVNLQLDSRPAGEVTVRYEYYDALVRLGVFPRPRPAEDALRRRERARGFEDGHFSPEP